VPLPTCPVTERPPPAAPSPARRTRGERAKLILRALGVLLALPGVFVILGSGAGEWSAVGWLLGLGLLLAAAPAFVAAEFATSWSRRLQVAALLISLAYLGLLGYLFVNGLAYALQRRIGTAGLWLLILASGITLAPLASTVLLGKVVASGDQ
jgi:hypothetical protein